MKRNYLFKAFIGLLVVGVIASGLVYGELLPSHKKRGKRFQKELAHLTNPKVKKIFCYLQNDSESVEDCLKNAGPLTEEEINIAYQTAMNVYNYDLAEKLYHMGATDCYKEGQDILWVAVNKGNFGLAEKLLEKDYLIELYHINAARSLINVDQSNWAFIYGKEDEDREGFQEYQERAKYLAEKIIVKYKSQQKKDDITFPEFSIYKDKYQVLFGKKPDEAFRSLVEATLEGGFAFDHAKHGSQKTKILVNEIGEKIGVIKSRNELLAQQIDDDHFAGVPPILEMNIPGHGNVIIQKWVPNTLMATQYRHVPIKNFMKLPNVIEELHHIRILDIRLGNSDRNRGNLLVKKCDDLFYLIPIDHDLLMHYIPNDMNWEALYLNVPFSKESQKKIQSIDLKKDEQKMRALSYNGDEIRSMKIRTTLLKMSTEKNLTLKEIDMLFRFFYYDFLDDSKNLSASAEEAAYREALSPSFEKFSETVKQPTEVWKLIGNNFELYI